MLCDDTSNNTFEARPSVSYTKIQSTVYYFEKILKSERYRIDNIIVVADDIEALHLICLFVCTLYLNELSQIENILIVSFGLLNK